MGFEFAFKRGRVRVQAKVWVTVRAEGKDIMIRAIPRIGDGSIRIWFRFK